VSKRALTADIRTPDSVIDAPGTPPAGTAIMTTPTEGTIPLIDAVASPAFPETLIPEVSVSTVFGIENRIVPACVVPNATVNVTGPSSSVYPILVSTDADELTLNVA
jgi:hypothetical protein